MPNFTDFGTQLAPLISCGEPFLFCRNTQLPFPDGSVALVISNGVPLDKTTWLGPGVQKQTKSSESSNSGGEWLPRPYPNLRENMNTTFSSLLSRSMRPVEAQEDAHTAFPGRVLESRLKLRRPPTQYPDHWSAFYNRRRIVFAGRIEPALSTVLEDSLEEGQTTTDVQVFDVLDCRDKEDFAGFIPGIGSVCQTPILRRLHFRWQAGPTGIWHRRREKYARLAYAILAKR